MTFDGKNKLILLDEKETVLDIKEVYYKWKEWSANIKNITYPFAMRFVGGDKILDRKLGLTYFLINGWKIKPASKNYTLNVEGNIYSEDGTTPFVAADGDVNVVVINTVSNLIDIIPVKGYNNTMNPHSSSVPAQTNSVEDEDDDWTLTQ